MFPHFVTLSSLCHFYPHFVIVTFILCYPMSSFILTLSSFILCLTVYPRYVTFIYVLFSFYKRRYKRTMFFYCFLSCAIFFLCFVIVTFILCLFYVSPFILCYPHSVTFILCMPNLFGSVLLRQNLICQFYILLVLHFPLDCKSSNY